MRQFHRVNGCNDETDMPKRKTKKSAGYDIVATETTFIQPNQCLVIPSNIKMLVEDNEFILVVPRSSLYRKHKLTMVNSVGIIDADYFGNKDNDGNVGMVFKNDSNVVQVVGKNEAIAQAIILEYKTTDDDEADGERVGGYGSTDNIVKESVYHDNHYAEMDVQPIELAQAIQTHEAFVGGLYLNAVKYHLRAGHKAGESFQKDKDKRNRYISWHIHASRGEYIDPRLDYPVHDYEIEDFATILINVLKNGKRKMRDREQHNKQNLERYHWLKEHHICVSCGHREAFGKYVRCEDCLYKQNEANHKRKEKWNNYIRERSRKLQEEGKCANCGKIRDGESIRLCSRCLETRNRSRRKWDRAKRQETNLSPEELYRIKVETGKKCIKFALESPKLAEIRKRKGIIMHKEMALHKLSKNVSKGV